MTRSVPFSTFVLFKECFHWIINMCPGNSMWKLKVSFLIYASVTSVISVLCITLYIFYSYMCNRILSSKNYINERIMLHILFSLWLFPQQYNGNLILLGTQFLSNERLALCCRYNVRFLDHSWLLYSCQFDELEKEASKLSSSFSC
jgi:hypothetical protein